MSFIGLWTVAQFVIYVTMASISHEHVPEATLLDFGALNAPRYTPSNGFASYFQRIY